MQRKLRQFFSETVVDAVLIRTFPHTTDPNFSYFSGLSTHIFHSNWLLLEKKRKPLLLCSSLEKPGAKTRKELRVVTVRSSLQVIKLLKKRLKNKVLGVNYSLYPHQNFQLLKKTLKPKRIVNVSKQIGKLRETKTKEEVQNIRTACKISEQALGKVPKIVRHGKTEEQIALELEWEARKAGAEKLAFPTIVAFGANAAVPHHISGKTKIKKGNFLLIDFGAKFKNYCSDISRTFFVGTPTKEQQWHYWLVRFAQEKALQSIQPGIPAQNVFQIANKILQKGLKKELPHALGHGLGIEEHDCPARIGPEEKWCFQSNQVLAIEPAAYFKNRFGIRIEDDCLVSINGVKRLSQAPKKLVSL